MRFLNTYSHRYSSDYSIIKYEGFELIYYTINLDVVSSFWIFREFVSIFLLNVLLV